MQVAVLIAVALANVKLTLFCRHQTLSGRNHVKFVAGATSMSISGQCMQLQMGMGILKGIRTEFLKTECLPAANYLIHCISTIDMILTTSLVVD